MLELRSSNRFIVVSLILCASLTPSISHAAFVSWGAGATLTVRDIDPITHTDTAVQLYGYSNPFGASYNPSLSALAPISDTYITYLYQGPDGLSLFGVFDRPQDGTGGFAEMLFTSTGLAGTGMQFVVKDDPGDSSYAWNDLSGTANPGWRWNFCCTDGFALGYITPQEWSLTTSFRSLSGISRFLVFYSENGTINSLDVPASEINGLTFYDIAPVPVPAAAWLFGTALIGLVGFNRRRKAV